MDEAISWVISFNTNWVPWICNIYSKTDGQERKNWSWVFKNYLKVTELKEFKPLWIEEPTSPDDVLGHATIAKVYKQIFLKLYYNELPLSINILRTHFMNS